MAFEVWDSLTDTTKHIIHFGAVAAAFTAMYVFYSWVWPTLQAVYRKVQWIMSDENDHAIIMDRLDRITGMLEPNGGTSLADSINRIEHSVMFQGARSVAALHTNPNPIFETNREGKVNFVNHSYSRIFGIDGGDAEDMGWVNIIPQQHRDGVVTKWFRAVTDKRTFDEFVPLVGADGKTLKTHVVAYVIRGDRDNMLGHHGEVKILKDKE